MDWLWCWRCQQEMPMLDGAEAAEIESLYGECTEKVKAYRNEHGTALRDTPVHEIYAPVRDAYERFTGVTGLHQDEIRRHWRGRLGPPCPSCGKPFRTPRAKLCAACWYRFA